jgi:hypothetical protein
VGALQLSFPDAGHLYTELDKHFSCVLVFLVLLFAIIIAIPVAIGLLDLFALHIKYFIFAIKTEYKTLSILF